MMSWVSASPNAVAPHAGAWVETVITLSFTTMVEVAPHAGAWVETNIPV